MASQSFDPLDLPDWQTTAIEKGDKLDTIHAQRIHLLSLKVKRAGRVVKLQL